MKYKEGPREQERAKERKRGGCVCVGRGGLGGRDDEHSCCQAKAAIYSSQACEPLLSGAVSFVFFLPPLISVIRGMNQNKQVC